MQIRGNRNSGGLIFGAEERHVDAEGKADQLQFGDLVGRACQVVGQYQR